jgi:VanZ family protein
MSSPSHPISLVRLLASALRSPRPWQLLLCVLLVAVCFLALTPAPPKTIDLGWDKLNHTGAFAALTLSGCFAFPDSRRAMLVLLFSLLALGGLIEILQSYVPGREGDWYDLLADALGMAVGTALALSALRLTRQAPPA